MNKADRDKYLGAIQGCLPSLYDADAEAPLETLALRAGRISAKTDREEEVLRGALNANLPEQLALFKVIQSEVRHTLEEKSRQRRLYCD